jgi:hypothetical protein
MIVDLLLFACFYLLILIVLSYCLYLIFTHWSHVIAYYYYYYTSMWVISPNLFFLWIFQSYI